MAKLTAFVVIFNIYIYIVYEVFKRFLAKIIDINL